jgi:hypothetical protein
MHHESAGKGDFLKTRFALLASASLFVCAPALAEDASLAADAKAFGVRDAVIEPDLSSDGTRVIYVTPGPGRKSIAVIGNLGSGQFVQVAGSNGDPNILRWCNFASANRVVCRITGTTTKSVADEPIVFSRLVSLNNDGSDLKMLGQTDSFYDAWIRQVDASIVDRLDGADNKLLLERQYVPEEGKLNTRLVRTRSVEPVMNGRSLITQTNCLHRPPSLANERVREGFDDPQISYHLWRSCIAGHRSRFGGAQRQRDDRHAGGGCPDRAGDLRTIL